jgi:hypothetical protein
MIPTNKAPKIDQDYIDLIDQDSIFKGISLDKKR